MEMKLSELKNRSGSGFLKYWLTKMLSTANFTEVLLSFFVKEA